MHVGTGMGQRHSCPHQHQRNIQPSDLEGHEKGKGTQTAMLGPAVGTPSWHLSLKDIRWSRKEIRLRAKSIRFPGKVVGGKRKYIYL